MQVRMVQRAVGQGGLHCGELTLGHKPLRWVYDCGSNQADALKREVGSIARDSEIDLLFLSHLDSDHVNGVDLLLSQVKVREVILPYLNEEALVATIARDISRGGRVAEVVEIRRRRNLRVT
ncbi:metallo-beta-lactamase superfamily protein [Salipiger aestuarii]|uniref:Metallo-beta-lactamase superfamily protein n=2 Tax=Salipiger aestuarii TaxID=568098 RepID=A0A327YD25_9RHOB|nr:MBL fold metallo-hydrolase [Salipiger aestuarii]RAK18960.1 metallo-beta-lactamase superfamily protein [Salipiger aestuarii]